MPFRIIRPQTVTMNKSIEEACTSRFYAARTSHDNIIILVSEYQPHTGNTFWTWVGLTYKNSHIPSPNRFSCLASALESKIGSCVIYEFTDAYDFLKNWQILNNPL